MAEENSENKSDGNLPTGSCLCGDVSYELSGNMGIFQYCHCSRCRKFTGSAHASNIFVKPEQFSWLSGEEQVGKFAPKDAKHFATAFCKQCGSSLPWANQGGTVMIIPAGTLDNDPVIRPTQSIHCASGADWYTEVSSLPMHDEMPPRKA